MTHCTFKGRFVGNLALLASNRVSAPAGWVELLLACIAADGCGKPKHTADITVLLCKLRTGKIKAACMQAWCTTPAIISESVAVTGTMLPQALANSAFHTTVASRYASRDYAR
jgi:hypothetical protein